MRRLSFVVAVAFALAAFQCASFDEGVDEPSGADAGDSGGTDGTTGEDASSDAGDDASCGMRDFANDAKHCGRCNHSCAGGECVDGFCQPFVLLKAATPGEIARSGTRVFVEVTAGQNNDIVSCPRSGCGSNPTPILAAVDDVTSMVFTDGRLYFATQSAAATNALESCDPSDCAGTRAPVAPPAPSPYYGFTPLRVFDGALVFGQFLGTDGELRRYADGGPASEPLAKTSCPPARIAVSSTALSWTCAGALSVYECGVPCTVDGGSPSAASTSPFAVGQIERSGPHLVYEDTNGTLAISDGVGSTPLPPRGTGPIAISKSDLFFQNSLAGRIETCRLPTCANTQSIATTTATAMVVDDDAVFWTVPSENVVMSVAR